MSETWRVGRKVGRTLYEQIGAEPSDEDQFIGALDSGRLAREAVASRNALSWVWDIPREDLRIEPQFAGDQPVNENPRGAVLTHLPTSTVIVVEDDRSYLQNSAVAIGRLRDFLLRQVERPW
jgi:hypothetical protein